MFFPYMKQTQNFPVLSVPSCAGTGTHGSSGQWQQSQGSVNGGGGRREIDPASDRLSHGGRQSILACLDYMSGMKGRQIYAEKMNKEQRPYFQIESMEECNKG